MRKAGARWGSTVTTLNKEGLFHHYYREMNPYMSPPNIFLQLIKYRSVWFNMSTINMVMYLS